jgi:predicted ATPase/DNA-binding SARP family transcriptional activator
MTMARLSLTLLGRLEVTLDGESITGFQSNKVRALLVYLATEADRPHRRDVLATLLWPNSPDRAARANLRRALSNLRRVIRDHDAHPPFLTITRDTIQFNSASDSRLDVAAFKAFVEANQRDEPTIGQLQEAVALYQGPFLVGFSLKDSAAFDDWTLLTQERLQRQALMSLRRLAEQHERGGDLERACQAAWRQVQLEPWQEGARRELMRLLALSGQRSAALAQYEACRRTLMADLGVEPVEETVALYHRIRDGAELPSPGRGPPHNLPAPLTPLIGREGLLAEIKERLQDPACRLLSLVGPGGSGKTRLALEAAARELDRFDNGVFFVSLAPLESVDSIVPAIAQALDLPLTPTVGSAPEQQLLDYLRTKHTLLILDNFEHVLEGVEVLSTILRTAPQVKAITTSRARLNARGEHLLPVPGLDAPFHVPEAEPQRMQCIRDLTRYAAIKLFVSSARRVWPEFDPGAEELAHVGDICRLVQGMPLAILLSASWMMMLTPGDIAAQISRKSLDFLETEWRDVPQRQRSMRAVFDHSWSLLTERQRGVFSGLSVFRGGFLHEAAQQVTGASLRELMSLVDRSLLQRTATARHEVHELLRQYAAEKLALSPVAEEGVRARHSAYYTAALGAWKVDLRGPRQKEALAEMEADIDNARVAWNWAVGRGDVERTAQAMEGLCRFYERRGRFPEGEAVCRLAAERLEEMEKELAAEGPRALARAWGWQGLFNGVMGRTELARQLLHQGLALLDQPPLGRREPVSSLAEEPVLSPSKEPALSLPKDTRRERAFLLQQLGRTLFQSNREETERLWEHSLALYRVVGDRWGEASVLSDLGELSFNLSDYGRAKQRYEQSLALRRSLGDHMGIADALRGLGDTAGYQGRFEEAQRLARESVALLRDIGDRRGVANALFVSAWVLGLQGRFTAAHQLLEDVAGLQEDLGDRSRLPWTNQELTWMKINLGWYEEARALAQHTLPFFREIGDHHGIGLMHLHLGQIALAGGAYAKAQELLQECIALSQDLGEQREASFALIQLGRAQLGLGRRSGAQQCLVEALRIAAETAGWEPSIHSVCLTALLLVDRGELERAIELYALASRYGYVGNSRYHEDTAGKHIAALAATLPPEVVLAARARGRARDMEATIAELLSELE